MISKKLEQAQNDVEAACDVLTACYERGWISTRDGNISINYKNEKTLAVSPSGAIKYKLRPEQFLHIPLQHDSNIIDLDVVKKPSGELSLHRKVQSLMDKEHNTVLHVHATYAIAALYAGWKLNDIVEGFPEVGRYTRVGQDVPALAATSEELAEATEQSFKSGMNPHIVGLDRHGVVAIGRNPWDAFEHVERLEHICKIVLLSCRKPANP